MRIFYSLALGLAVLLTETGSKTSQPPTVSITPSFAAIHRTLGQAVLFVMSSMPQTLKYRVHCSTGTVLRESSQSQNTRGTTLVYVSAPSTRAGLCTITVTGSVGGVDAARIRVLN